MEVLAIMSLCGLSGFLGYRLGWHKSMERAAEILELLKGLDDEE